MVTNGEKWHYIALKSEHTDDGFNRPIRSFSRLLYGITSNHHGDLIAWITYIHLERITHLKNMKGKT